MMISVFNRVENISGKGEIAGNQHFLLSHNVFILGLILKVIKSQDYVVSLYQMTNFLFDQIQIVSRQQNKCSSNDDIYLGQVRKHC